jgi:hypothetical protein
VGTIIITLAALMTVFALMGASAAENWIDRWKVCRQLFGMNLAIGQRLTLTIAKNSNMLGAGCRF